MSDKPLTRTQQARADSLAQQHRVQTPYQAIQESKARARDELAQRQAAKTILAPDEVRGEYDAGRVFQLFTSLGGNGPRSITDDDLRQFAFKARELGKKFTGGIKAQQVIDMSLPARRASANSEIANAVPLESRGGRLHFLTNAGPASKVIRHHVHVEFLNYGASVASPTKASTLARGMATGPLRFDCDCEDHRFRFRYIASVGNFHAGRAETGFPKLTNPNLKGVACKHVLRVMRALSSALVLKKLEAMVEAGRAALDDKAPKKPGTSRATKAELQQMAAKQQAQAKRRAANVESSEERQDRLAKARAIKAASRSPVANRVTPGADAKPSTARELERLKQDALRNLELLAVAGRVKPEDVSGFRKLLYPAGA